MAARLTLASALDTTVGTGLTLAGEGQRLDDVARDDAVDAEALGGDAPGAGVQARAGARGGERVDGAREQRGDHAAEDVAGARRGERGRRARADGDYAVGAGD